MEPNAPPQIFHRRRIRQARARSAPHFAAADFLHRRAMTDIVDRLESVTRDFPDAVFYGAGGLTNLLTPACGVGRIVHADLTAARLPPDGRGVIFDEERSPLAPHSVDLIVSLLTLHSANDLVGALVQHRAALKPDGLFVAALFGEETLRELKAAFYEAESALSGGASPRIAPFAGVRDLGGAMQRAGFAMPVADLDTVEAHYREPARLLADLRGMGETGALIARGAPLNRRLIAAALERFADRGGAARFDIVYLTGWAPHPGQPRPLKPGSGKASLEAAIKSGGGGEKRF